MSKGVAALFMLMVLTHAVRVRAEAEFVIRARGDGFSDRSTVAPEGGNSATTLGEQRKAALEYAASLWGARLESSVPIELEVMFQKLGCDENGAPLAGASAVSLFSGISAHGADPALWYPSPLANRLAGKDMAPDEADIRIYINTSIDEECRDRFHGFYYGFDGKPRERMDLVEILLHELGHGLGFSSFVDLDSGMPDEGGVDVFSAHILDLATNKTWRELTNEGRRASALNVRGLAFQGASTTKAARELLAKGSPRLSLVPAVSGFIGAVGETGKSYPDFEGPVRLSGTFEGCVNSTANLSGAVVLIRPACMGTGQLAPRLTAAGVAGALIVLPSDYAQPAVSTPIWAGVAGIPSLIVSRPDAELMLRALDEAPLRARAQWDSSRLAGADSEGRPLLFASQPADEGSSVSHFEPLTRPDLLMEPFSADTATHAFDLTWPVLLDIGWTPVCGNRQLDAGEECDDGDANSDSAPNACRMRCRRASCGDGVVDASERCDQGKANSDTAANACRTSCMPARCGDGVLDTSEACDQGASNDDARPNACRSDCRVARCGDGVVDEREQCDGSADCSRTCALIVSEPERDAGSELVDDTNPDAPEWLGPSDRSRDDGRARKDASGCALAGEARGASRWRELSDGWTVLLLCFSAQALRSRSRSRAARRRS
jgi:hypothetical protein